MANKTVEHSTMFEQIKEWYKKGKWSKRRVHNAVEKNRITTAEYEEITGDQHNG